MPCVPTTCPVYLGPSALLILYGYVPCLSITSALPAASHMLNNTTQLE